MSVCICAFDCLRSEPRKEDPPVDTRRHALAFRPSLVSFIFLCQKRASSGMSSVLSIRQGKEKGGSPGDTHTRACSVIPRCRLVLSLCLSGCVSSSQEFRERERDLSSSSPEIIGRVCVCVIEKECKCVRKDSNRVSLIVCTVFGLLFSCKYFVQ